MPVRLSGHEGAEQRVRKAPGSLPRFNTNNASTYSKQHIMQLLTCNDGLRVRKRLKCLRKVKRLCAPRAVCQLRAAND